MRNLLCTLVVLLAIFSATPTLAADVAAATGVDAAAMEREVRDQKMHPSIPTTIPSLRSLVDWQAYLLGAGVLGTSVFDLVTTQDGLVRLGRQGKEENPIARFFFRPNKKGHINILGATVLEGGTDAGIMWQALSRRQYLVGHPAESQWTWMVGPFAGMAVHGVAAGLNMSVHIK